MHTQVSNHKKNLWLNGEPITLQQIKAEINDPLTRSGQVNYLKKVLSEAEYMTARMGRTLEDIEWSLEDNGDIHPFGARPEYIDTKKYPDFSGMFHSHSRLK